MRAKTNLPPSGGMLKSGHEEKSVGNEQFFYFPPWLVLLTTAAAVRILLLLYGEWQDRNMAVKFTDVDYRVFTDAAEHVLHSESPYDRLTFRYTPLLAFMMTLNLTVHECIGKVIFSLLDLAVGMLIHAIVKSVGHSERLAVLSAGSWLYNPLTMAISTRGNAESLLAVLVLACIWLLYTKRTIAAGVVLGMAVHCKFFPIIYCLPMYLFIDDGFGARPLVTLWSSRAGILAVVSNFCRPRRLLFAAVTAGTFFTLSTWMYLW